MGKFGAAAALGLGLVLLPLAGRFEVLAASEEAPASPEAASSSADEKTLLPPPPAETLSSEGGVDLQSGENGEASASPVVGEVQVEGVVRSVAIERAPSLEAEESLQQTELSQPPPSANDLSAKGQVSEAQKEGDLQSREAAEEDASGGGPSSFADFMLRPLRGLPTLLAQRIQLALKLSAVACAVLMQLTPLRTVVRITSCRNTQGLESLPFFSLLLSAALWLLYGALLHDVVILLPNATGALAGASYVAIFWKHCPRDDKQRFLLGWYFRVGGLLLGTLLGCCCFCSAATSEAVVGLVASLVNVVSYAAPLASLQAVLREKSTALMPVEMCVGNFCCSALWLSYGWISEDSFIILPNFLGFCVGVAQLTLYGVFPPPARLGFAAVRGSSNAGLACSSVSRFGGKDRCHLGGLLGAPPLGSGISALQYSASPARLKIEGNHFYAAPGEIGVNCKSVCGRGPSLPTHEELLRECGLEDPEDLNASLAL